MTHQNVLRAFQTSWTRRRELHQNVVEPLYSEIKFNCERIEKYERGEHKEYQSIILNQRYLYDLLESHLQDAIDEFYRRIDELSLELGYWTGRIAAKIINEEICRIFGDYRDRIEEHIEEDHLFASITIREPTGRMRVVSGNTINGALLQRITVKDYLQFKNRNEEIVKFELVIHFKRPPTKDIPISKSTFGDLWKNCKSKAATNETYLSIWNEIPDLLQVGRGILAFISGK